MGQKAQRVAVVYTHFPHYRAAVFDALSTSDKYEFEFFYDPRGIERTILNGRPKSNHSSLAVRSVGPLLFQWGSVRLSLSSDFDAYIFLGNPFIVTTWLAAAIARFRRRSVLFWTHGWLRPEYGPKALLRRTFYRLAHFLLVYGNRARELGDSCGYEAVRIRTVYNSLDYEIQKLIRENLSESRPSTPYFLCVARLVESVDLPLAFAAAKLLRDRSVRNFELIIVGDGPLRKELEAEARRLHVPVRFAGSIHDERVLATLFNGCTAVISPGKLGLLAMHAFAYGARVITHGDLDFQMPEVEAVEEGVTGLFFRRGDAEDLADKMLIFLRNPTSVSQRNAAIQRIETDYNPSSQAIRIEEALSDLLRNRR